MGIDSLVKVLVFLDKGLYIVPLGVDLFRGQERLSGRHPVLSLLAVPVEELQLEVLVQLYTSSYPRPIHNKRMLCFTSSL